MKMSTNYYWKEERHEQEENIQQHIGKRSGAGLYCYDCGTTLNRGGVMYIHQGKNGTTDDLFNVWLDKCPSCGNSKEGKDGFENSTSALELGFAKEQDIKKSGISTCCSFTWTLKKHMNEIMQIWNTGSDEKIIVDEYGEEFSAGEFIKMLEICPIEFQTPSEFF